MIIDPLSRNNIDRNSIIGGKGGTLNAFGNNGYGKDGFAANGIPYGGESFGHANSLGDSVYTIGNQNIANAGFNKDNSLPSHGYGNNVFGDRNVFGGDKGLGGVVFGDVYSSGVGISDGYGLSGRASLGGSNPFSRDSLLGKSGFGNQDVYGVGVTGAGKGSNIYGGFDASGVIGTNSGYTGNLKGKRGIIGGSGYSTFGRDGYGLGGKVGGYDALPNKGGKIWGGDGFSSGNFGGKSLSGNIDTAFGDNLYRK